MCLGKYLKRWLPFFLFFLFLSCFGFAIFFIFFLVQILNVFSFKFSFKIQRSLTSQIDIGWYAQHSSVGSVEVKSRGYFYQAFIHTCRRFWGRFRVCTEIIQSIWSVAVVYGVVLDTPVRPIRILHNTELERPLGTQILTVKNNCERDRSRRVFLTFFSLFRKLNLGAENCGTLCTYFALV